MIPDRLRAVLREARVRYCVIGAHALAVHGVVRFTADVDLLTRDGRVLDAEFWPHDLRPSLRVGDADDPLAGVARFDEPAVDLIVGRGTVMRRALEEAVEPDRLGDPVVPALWLALLKLEAGGVQDLADLELLIEARRRAGEDLRSQITAERSTLTEWGRRSWKRVQARLDHLA